MKRFVVLFAIVLASQAHAGQAQPLTTAGGMA